MEDEYKHPVTPKYLYKYRSLENDKTIQRLEQMIVNRQLYFSTKAELNDPFEFSFKPVHTMSNSESFDYFCNGYLKEGKNVCDAMILAHKISHDLEKFIGDPEEFIHKHPDANEQNDYHNMGIFSLSEDPKNIQMWSYYADKHKGVCVEFDTEIMSPNTNKEPAIQVEYSETNEYPEVELLSMAEEMPKKIAHKHFGWKHEKEWRMICANSDGKTIQYYNGLLECKRQAVSSIILGIRATECPKTVTRIREWIGKVKEKDRHIIKLKQAIPVKNKFEIEIKDFCE